MLYKVISGGVTAPRGFKAAGVACGIKRSGKPDLAIVFSERDASAAGVFTKNEMAAPSVVLSRDNLAKGSARAIVVNSGNANACTGKQGEADAVSMAEMTARALGLCADEVVVASTGVIGVPLPIDRIRRGIEEATASLSDAGSADAAAAILTTDTFPKERAIEVELSGGTVRIGGIAKGSGMIAPDMATMLAFLTSDASIHPDDLRSALRSVAERTFNSITVDGETSTNDMVVALANGASGVKVGHGDLPAFEKAFEKICSELAKMIVRDGEGATKLVEITVDGAKSDAEAKKAAMAIANSNLVKTAAFGCDPNWGRIVVALGHSGVRLDPGSIAIKIGGIGIVDAGSPLPFDEKAASDEFGKEEVRIEVNLGIGEGAATVWTCDLSYDYVRINSEYRT